MGERWGAATQRDSRGHTGTRITQTNLTTIPTHQMDPCLHQNAPARLRDDRIRGRLNSRFPGADRSLRPTQKRPPPANPTLPPPAARPAPPRACSKAVGEMKARAADAETRSGRRCGPSPL